MVGGVKLNLTDFTWFTNFYIFTDHYLFQCLKVMFFGYLQAAGGGQEGKHGYLKFAKFLLYGPPSLGRENIFKIEVLS